MTPVPETRVPDDERPAATCPYCDRPFRRERERDLHVGEKHGTESTDAEHDAYERADEEEVDELFFFHMKIVAAISLVYGAFVIVYGILAG